MYTDQIVRPGIPADLTIHSLHRLSKQKSSREHRDKIGCNIFLFNLFGILCIPDTCIKNVNMYTFWRDVWRYIFFSLIIFTIMDNPKFKLWSQWHGSEMNVTVFNYTGYWHRRTLFRLYLFFLVTWGGIKNKNKLLYSMSTICLLDY